MIQPASSTYKHWRYWPTWFGFGLLRLLSLLPLPVIAFLGKLLGRLVYWLMGTRRKITLRNIRTCFPNKSPAECESIAKRCFELIAQTLLCMGINWWAPVSRLQKLVSFEGKEHYDAALSRGQNVILLAPHAIALEMGGLLLSHERPMITMYKTTRKPLLNAMVIERRGRFDGVLVERNEPLRRLLKLIRSGKPFYYLPDQDAGERGVFVPFFGQTASTYPVLGKFVQMTDAVVIPCFTHILPNGKGWHVVMKPPLENFPVKDEHDDAAVMNVAIEQLIAEAPEQYFWVHKRFKTQPSGVPHFYRKA